MAAVAPFTLNVPPLPDGLLVTKAGLPVTVNVTAGRHNGAFVTEYDATVIGWVSMPTIRVAAIGDTWLNDIVLTSQMMITLKFFVTEIVGKPFKETDMVIGQVPS